MHGLPTFLIDHLQNVQNAAARIITHTKKYDHIKPVLKQLHWLPVNQRINYKILLLTYKALNGQAASYITELLEPYTPARNLRSSSKNLLKIPLHFFRALRLPACFTTEQSAVEASLFVNYRRNQNTIKTNVTNLLIPEMKTYFFKKCYSLI